LCARLDNLPLARELAAARTRILSPAQLLDRLAGRLDLLKAGRGVDARQQTLRATIEWSHELLNDEERRLFARFAVFAGGCTVDAVEAVCDADLETLQSLVDKSLLRHNEERFWMLQTIHEFASERLKASGEAQELRQRHADHFLALVETAPGLAESAALSANVADTSSWRRDIERDYDNIRAALAWFDETGQVGSQLRIGFVVAWLYLWMRGSFREPAQWFESISANPNGSLPSSVLTRFSPWPISEVIWNGSGDATWPRRASTSPMRSATAAGSNGRCVGWGTSTS
jgi:predicted ATPase